MLFLSLPKSMQIAIFPGDDLGAVAGPGELGLGLLARLQETAADLVAADNLDPLDIMLPLSASILYIVDLSSSVLTITINANLSSIFTSIDFSTVALGDFCNAIFLACCIVIFVDTVVGSIS